MTNETQTKPRSAPAERYDPRAIEKKWEARWEADELYLTPDDDPRPKWYALTMLPMGVAQATAKSPQACWRVV